MGSYNMQEGGMSMQPQMSMQQQMGMGMPANGVGNLGGMMMQQGYGYQNNPALMRNYALNMNYQGVQGMAAPMRFVPGIYGNQMSLAQGMYGDLMGLPMQGNQMTMPGRFIPGPYGTQMSLAQGMYGDLMGLPMAAPKGGKKTR